MKKIFKTTLDIGGIDSLCFKDFNTRLLELVRSYRSFYNGAMKIQKDRGNLFKNENELLQVILKGSLENINESITKAAISRAFETYAKNTVKSSKEGSKSFHINSPENLIISSNTMPYFYLNTTVSVNGGGYLFIPYKNNKELKIRLADEYIPKDKYDKAGFFFNKRKWVVYLQSQKEESSYKIKKFRLDCSEILIYADGSGVFNEKEFYSAFDIDAFEELYERYLEEKAKGLRSRELSNLRRRIRDFNRGRYLMIIRDIIKSCPRKIYLTSFADFYSQEAKKSDLIVFVNLLEQATSLYGIEFITNLSHPLNKKEENLTTLKWCASIKLELLNFEFRIILLHFNFRIKKK